MKWILYIVLVFCSLNSFGQNWRDTLDLAREAYKKEDFGKALDYYEKAQKGAPENVDLSDEMAQSAYKARKFEQAEKIYQQGNGSKKDRQEKAAGYHNLGNSRMKQKNYQGAIDAYKESLRQNPNDEQTRYNLSEAIRQLKNQEKNQNNNSGNSNSSNNNSAGNQNNSGNPSGNQNNMNNPSNGNKNQHNQDNPSDDGNPSQNEGTLPNKNVDRMLDKLMRDEAETKRKMAGNQGGNSAPHSGKDW